MNISTIISIAITVALVLNIAGFFQIFMSEDHPVRIHLEKYTKKLSLARTVFMFLDWCYLYLAICSAISIYQYYQGVVNLFDSSVVISTALLLVATIYMVVYPCARLSDRLKKCEPNEHSTQLEKDPKIQELLKDRQRSAVTFNILTILRRLALAAAVTFGRIDFIVQFGFINLCSIFLIVYLGRNQSFKTIGQQRLALWNEFCLLVLCG